MINDLCRIGRGLIAFGTGVIPFFTPVFAGCNREPSPSAYQVSQTAMMTTMVWMRPTGRDSAGQQNWLVYCGPENYRWCEKRSQNEINSSKFCFAPLLKVVNKEGLTLNAAANGESCHLKPGAQVALAGAAVPQGKGLFKTLLAGSGDIGACPLREVVGSFQEAEIISQTTLQHSPSDPLPDECTPSSKVHSLVSSQPARKVE